MSLVFILIAWPVKQCRVYYRPFISNLALNTEGTIGQNYAYIAMSFMFLNLITCTAVSNAIYVPKLN